MKKQDYVDWLVLDEIYSPEIRKYSVDDLLEGNLQSIKFKEGYVRVGSSHRVYSLKDGNLIKIPFFKKDVSKQDLASLEIKSFENQIIASHLGIFVPKVFGFYRVDTEISNLANFGLITQDFGRFNLENFVKSKPQLKILKSFGSQVGGAYQKGFIFENSSDISNGVYAKKENKTYLVGGWTGSEYINSDRQDIIENAFKKSKL